jgi:hypothetical protein
MAVVATQRDESEAQMRHPARRNGKVTTRKASQVELTRLHALTASQQLWATVPRSQLVTPEVKRIGNGGFGLDSGGKYWR